MGGGGPEKLELGKVASPPSVVSHVSWYTSDPEMPPSGDAKDRVCVPWMCEEKGVGSETWAMNVRGRKGPYNGTMARSV